MRPICVRRSSGMASRVRFVRGKLGMAPGVARVQGDRHVVWLVVAQGAEQLAGKAIDRGGRLAGAGRERRLHPEIGAIGL